jgi:hypothetical protein
MQEPACLVTSMQGRAGYRAASQHAGFCMHSSRMGFDLRIPCLKQASVVAEQ